MAAHTGAYRYYTTFYSGDDCTGKSLTVYSAAQSISPDFTPRSVAIDRQLPEDLLPGSRITVSSGETTKAALTDGTDAMWVSDGSGAQTVVFDLQRVYWLDRITLFHAASDTNYYGYYNTADFTLSVSSDGTDYTTVRDVKNNRDAQNDYTFDALPGRYIRLIITGGNRMDTNECRLLEVKAYGATYTGTIAGAPVPIGSRTVRLSNGDGTVSSSDGETSSDSTTPSDSSGAGNPTTSVTRKTEKRPTDASVAHPWVLPVAIGGGAVLILLAGGILWLAYRRKHTVNPRSE